MIFLETADLNKQIKAGNLNSIIENNTALLDDAELAALAEMQSYLRDRFDVATIFSATGTDRNSLLVMYLADMLLYHLHSRVAPLQMPEVRVTRYEAALEFLQDVNRGTLSLALPQTTEQAQKSDVLHVGENKRENRY